ncbi:MAG: tryptophan 2,3-dioxygenase [Oligoflexia bacterium]|nr:tryptophan 2,3-dioxygenase [Oligoflexia bacterium]
MALTYTSYLELEKLLNLQNPKKPEEHDELLFIIIHQVYELWFKQVLHEVGAIENGFLANDISKVGAGFKRVLTILKTLVAQVDVLETMTPLSFASFRDRLESASGFQSIQFRELEAALGKRGGQAMLERYPVGDPMRTRMEKAFSRPSVYDCFLKMLQKRGFKIPNTILNRNVQESVTESKEVQDILLDIYKTNAELTLVCERLVDIDEGIQEWRYRHVKMVERTIGTKIGTGGSAGADYLKSTLFKPFFPDLWAIRARF